MGLRQRRASNMPGFRNANYQFERQAKRAEQMGLGPGSTLTCPAARCRSTRCTTRLQIASMRR